MMSLAELFEEVLGQPALFVGNRSVVRIKSFVDGYRYALWKTGDDDESGPYYGFQRFVEERYNVRTSHSWDRIVCFMAADDVGGFELTKEMWKEYRSQYLAGS